MKQKILIFGGSGLLGSNLIYFLKKKYNFIINVNSKKFFYENVNYTSILQGNSIDENLLLEKIRDIKVNIVINCIANTNIEFCEKFPNLSRFENETIPYILSKVCNKLSIKLIHVSTDHLYDGKDNIKKKKSFKNKPLNVYAKQKLSAEKKISKECKKSLIIRTNFFGYSHEKKQFIDSIIDNASKNKKIYLFKDYFFTPISTKYFAFVLDQLIKRDIYGIINICSSEVVSKYEFGKKVIEFLNIDKNLIVQLKINQSNLYVKRCKNLSLSNKKMLKLINKSIPSLHEQINEYLYEKKKIEKKIFVKIPYGKHYVDKDDIKNVSRIIKSGSLTQGKYISETEKKICDYVGSKYAVLTSSATAALHITYKSLGMNYKSSLITSPITFVSTANAAIYCNSKIIFSDIDIDTISLSAENLIKNLNKKKCNLIAPVHMAGTAPNMQELSKIAKKNNINIVEDASHAMGANYSCGAKVGSCKYSIASIFSFHPVKIVASGEGGAITTNNRDLYEKLISLRSHGIISNKKMLNRNEAFSKGKKNIWYYEMQSLGFHYRQTEIHAALLNSQLDKIDRFLEKRRKIAKRYDLIFKKNEFIQPLQTSYRDISSNHLYIVKINFAKIKISRNDFMQKLRNKNIITQVHYIPLPFHPFYQNLGFSMKDLDNSKKYYKECLSLPIYYDLSLKQQDYVINSILELTNQKL